VDGLAGADADAAAATARGETPPASGVTVAGDGRQTQKRHRRGANNEGGKRRPDTDGGGDGAEQPQRRWSRRPQRAASRLRGTAAATPTGRQKRGGVV